MSLMGADMSPVCRHGRAVWAGLICGLVTHEIVILLHHHQRYTLTHGGQ